MGPVLELAPFKPWAFLAQIGPGRSRLHFAATASIYAQGDASDAVYYIQKGKAKVTVTSPAGKEAVLSLVGTGDFFGEGCMNRQSVRLTSVTAVTHCEVMRIEKSAMAAALRNEPEFSELFIGHLLQRNRRIQDDLIDQLFNSSEKRLARTLLVLANFGNDEKSDMVIAKISQETLAEMIGTTRSRVNFFMNKFRRLGMIEYNGTIKVHPSLTTVLNDTQTDDRRARSSKG
jgi:CRP-like cAMP-binding protein